MRLSYVVVFIFSTLILSCRQNTNKSEELKLKEKELELKEREIKLKEKEQQLSKQPQSVTESSVPKQEISNKQTIGKDKPINESKTKFCYVYTETNEPEERYDPGSISRPGELTTSPKSFYYTSTVVEVKNFSEDERAKLIDKFEQQVRDNFEIKNMRLESFSVQCSIINSECYSFDTYKAASESRRSK